MSWRETRDVLSIPVIMGSLLPVSSCTAPSSTQADINLISFVNSALPISLEGSWKQQLSNCLGYQGFVQTLRRKLAERGSWFRAVDPGSEADLEVHDEQLSMGMTFAFYESTDMDWHGSGITRTGEA